MGGGAAAALVAVQQAMEDLRTLNVSEGPWDRNAVRLRLRAECALAPITRLHVSYV